MEPPDHQASFPARPEDVSSLDAIIKVMYESISGPRGERDWNRIRSLHLPGSQLVPAGIRANGEHGLRILDIEGWIAGARAVVGGERVLGQFQRGQPHSPEIPATV